MQMENGAQFVIAASRRRRLTSLAGRWATAVLRVCSDRQHTEEELERYTTEI